MSPLAVAVLLGLLQGARVWKGWIVVPRKGWNETLYVKGDAVVRARMVASSRNGYWRREFAVYKRGTDPETARPVRWCDTLGDAIGE